MAAEAHVIHQDDPEPNGVGGYHDGVKVLYEYKVGLHKDVQPQHGALQHHGAQGHHGGIHVPLGRGLRLFLTMTSRGLIKVKEAYSMAAEAHVIHQCAPEPNGVGGDHVGAKVLDEHEV